MYLKWARVCLLIIIFFIVFVKPSILNSNTNDNRQQTKQKLFLQKTIYPNTISPLILVFGVEILGTKLKLRKVVRKSLVIAHVKVPKNPRPGFPFIAKIQDGRHQIKFF